MVEGLSCASTRSPQSRRQFIAREPGWSGVRVATVDAAAGRAPGSSTPSGTARPVGSPPGPARRRCETWPRNPHVSLAYTSDLLDPSTPTAWRVGGRPGDEARRLGPLPGSVRRRSASTRRRCSRTSTIPATGVPLSTPYLSRWRTSRARASAGSSARRRLTVPRPGPVCRSARSDHAGDLLRRPRTVWYLCPRRERDGKIQAGAGAPTIAKAATEAVVPTTSRHRTEAANSAGSAPRAGDARISGPNHDQARIAPAVILEMSERACRPRPDQVKAGARQA